MWWHQRLPTFPRHLIVLVTVHRAILVGSQAERYAHGLDPAMDKDWDLFIPYHHWAEATKTIPMTCLPNGRRGWRYSVDKTNYDVWPDDLARYMEEATSATRVRAKPGQPAYAVDLNNQILIRADRFPEAQVVQP